MKKLALLFLSLAAFSASAADKLKLDVNLYLNNQLVKSQTLTTQSDQLQTVTAEQKLQFTVTPTLAGDTVALNSSIAKFENGSYSTIANPELTVGLGKPATLEIGTEGVEMYKVLVTASKI